MYNNTSSDTVTDTNAIIQLFSPYVVGDYTANYITDGRFDIVVTHADYNYVPPSIREEVTKKALVELETRLGKVYHFSPLSNLQGVLYHHRLAQPDGAGVYVTPEGVRYYYANAPGSKQLYVVTEVDGLSASSRIESFARNNFGMPLIGRFITVNSFGDPVFSTHSNLDALKTAYNLLMPLGERATVSMLLCRVWEDVQQHTLIWLEKYNETALVEHIPAKHDRLVVYYAGVEMEFPLENLSTMFTLDILHDVHKTMYPVLHLAYRSLANTNSLATVEELKYQARRGVLYYFSDRVTVNRRLLLTPVSSNRLLQLVDKFGLRSGVDLLGGNVVFVGEATTRNYFYVVIIKTTDCIVYRTNRKTNKTTFALSRAVAVDWHTYNVPVVF